MRRRTAFQLFSPPAGVLLAVSVRYGLWLVVLCVTAVAVVLSRRHFDDRARWVPALLAARVIEASRSDAARDRVDVGAPELAVLAKGRLAVLDRALGLAHREGDERRWSLSVGRITVAQQLLEHGRVPGVVAAQGASTLSVVVWGLATGTCLVGAAITSSGWWLIPLLVAYSGAMVTWTDWRDERHWRPALVAAAANTAPPSSYMRGEGRVAADLVVLARGRIASVRRATQLVEAWNGSAEDKCRALQILLTAIAVADTTGVARAGRRSVALGWVATVTMTAATWFITG